MADGDSDGDRDVSFDLEAVVAPVVIVTGASRGIGAATARLAAGRGYDVCINYVRDRAAAEEVAADVRTRGRRALVVQADMGREADIVRLFAECDAGLGTPGALVNNAGILEQQTRVENIDAARLSRIFAVNVTGPFLCAREAVARMSRKRGGAGGAIVNISSVAARLGAPGEYVDYAASKAALDALTIGLAQGVAQEGIRVNGVRAGFIYTDIHASGGEPTRVDRVKVGVPLRRGGTAGEVANAVLWLLSDESAYTTGSFLEVAGGR